MDSIIALLIFFIFLYIIEKITEKREQKKELESLEELHQEDDFSDNCPYCNSKVKYLDNTCTNCQQQLKWE